jgi:hypothetical protein
MVAIAYSNPIEKLKKKRKKLKKARPSFLLVYECLFKFYSFEVWKHVE